MIGAEIRKRRRDKRMTIEELIDLLPLGWFPSKLAKIERGEQEVTAVELYEIMQALQAKKLAYWIISDQDQHQHAVV